MRNNNVMNNNFVKPNNFKHFPKYCPLFGFGLVSYTYLGFNLCGYKPGYKFNFKHKYKNSTLLRLLDYGFSRFIGRITDILGVPILRPIPVSIQCNKRI